MKGESLDSTRVIGVPLVYSGRNKINKDQSRDNSLIKQYLFHLFTYLENDQRERNSKGYKFVMFVKESKEKKSL